MKTEVKYVNVEVKKSMVDTVVKTVMIHEIPMLLAKHGEDNVLPHKYQPTDTAKEVDSQAELQRLVRLYGKGSESDISIAHEIYGNPNLPDSYGKESRLAKVMKRKDINPFFSENVRINTVAAPSTNSEEADKALKKDLSKPKTLEWFKSNGVTTVGEGEAETKLADLPAKELKEVSKALLLNMIKELEKPAPHTDAGTAVLTDLVTRYQEEG